MTAPHPLPPLDRLFVVLGFLDDYLGRWIDPDSPQVESFYADERRQAALFAAHLARLVADRALPATIERSIEDGRVAFRSREIAALIERFYVSDPDSFYADVIPIDAEGRPVVTRARIGKLDQAAFTSAARTAQLSYLVGVYQRHGSDGILTFANSVRKLEVVTTLLGRLGATAVEVSDPEPDDAPAVRHVRCTPPAELASWLARPDALPAPAASPSATPPAPDEPSDLDARMRRIDEEKARLDRATDDEAPYASAREVWLARAAARSADALAWFDAGYACLALTTSYFPEEAQLEHAARVFEEAIRLAPGARAGYWGLQRVQTARRQLEAAIDTARRATVAAPDDAQAWFALGQAFGGAAEPRRQEACDAYRRAAALDPASAEAHLMVADSLRALADRPREDELFPIYERVIALAPGSEAASTAEKALAYLRNERKRRHRSILDALRDGRGPMPFSTLLEKVRLYDAWLRADLETLEREGRVRREGEGWRAA